MAARDVFDESLIPREQVGVARIGRPVEPPRAPSIERFRRIGVARTVTTAVLAFVGAVWFAFPPWAVIVVPAAAVGVQCIARPAGVRWAAWSILLAAFFAEATLPFTWGARFVALLVFFAPFVSYLGFVMRGLPEP